MSRFSKENSYGTTDHMTDSLSEQIAQTHKDAQQGWKNVEANTQDILPRVFRRLSRRNFLKGATLFTAGAAVAGSEILGRGIEKAYAQESADVLKLVKTGITQEAAEQIGNQNLIEMMSQSRNPYQRIRVPFTPDEVLALAEVTSFNAQALQDLVNTTDTYGQENFQFECTVFCDENQEFSITLPSFLAVSEIEGDGHTFASGTLFVAGEDGGIHYLEPNQVISPSMADMLVISPELKATQTESYTHNGLSLNFNDFENGDVILVERTASQSDSQLLQVALQEATFPLVELRVYSGSGSAPNIRRQRSTDSEAIRVANTHDIYVTPFQLSLETVQGEASLNAANVQRDDQGRFFVVEGQYQWSLVEVRDDQNMHMDYGWVRNDVAGNPNIAYTATPLPPEVVSLEPTQTPAASENEERGPFLVEDQGEVFAFQVRFLEDGGDGSAFDATDHIRIQYTARCEFNVNGRTGIVDVVLAAFNSLTNQTYIYGRFVTPSAFQDGAFEGFREYLSGSGVDVNNLRVTFPNATHVEGNSVRDMYSELIQELYLDGTLLEAFANDGDVNHLPLVNGKRLLIALNTQ